MKRVICLSWFKRLLDRLVTDEKEDSEIASSQNDQHANATEEQEEKERPTFRFPIITDAEIYGWDDDEENTQITKTKNVPLKKQLMNLKRFHCIKTKDGQEKMFRRISIELVEKNTRKNNRR